MYAELCPIYKIHDPSLYNIRVKCEFIYTGNSSSDRGSDYTAQGKSVNTKE